MSAIKTVFYSISFVSFFDDSKILFYVHVAMSVQIAFPIVGSRKGVSPSRSHRTVHETLASHGSSYSVTNV